MASDGTYFDTDTKLMLHMDGTDASTTFTDSSSGGKTVTANGNAQIDTAQSKFGGASGLFDGTGDYLSGSYSSDFDLGTVFSIDCWARYTGTQPAWTPLFSTSDATNNGYAFFINGGYLQFAHWTAGSLDIFKLVALTWSADTWTHFYVGNNGTNYFLGVAGTVTSAAGDETSCDARGNGFVIGRQSTDWDGYYHAGWIEELRVIKGTCVWESNFTPPSAAYISGSPPSGSNYSNLPLLGVG